MSQRAARDGQPGNWEEPDFFLRRPETVRFRAESWQEPYESRGSRTDLRGTGGEIPPVYPTPISLGKQGDLNKGITLKDFMRKDFQSTAWPRCH